jgi:hypothetical protein
VHGSRRSAGIHRSPIVDSDTTEAPGTVDRMDTPLVTRLLAWQLLLPASASFTHLTAAALRGWRLPPLPDDLPVFACLPRTHPRPRQTGLVICRHPNAPPWELVRGVGCTTPAETILACARDLALLDLVVVIDAALHAEDVTLEELHAIARLRRRGAPALRRALPWVDGRSESAWESLLRILHVVCGIAVHPQYELFDEHGTFVARGDLWLVGTTMFHEYDGGDHLRKRQQRKDLKRARRLGHADGERRGYTSEDVLHQAVGVLRDADATVGRPHDPTRIRAWNALLRNSLFTPPGTVAFCRRIGLLAESGHSVTAGARSAGTE